MLARSCRLGQIKHARRYCTHPAPRKSHDSLLLTNIESWEQLFRKPGSVTAVAAQLRLLGKAKALSDGKRLHTHIHNRGFDRFTFVGNCLIEMYANCGSLNDARAAYDRLPNPNVYSWNMLIKAYGQNGSVGHAFHVFSTMPHKDSVSWNAMISAFTQHGHSMPALHLFHQMKKEGFQQNKITFLCTLDACANLGDLQEGQRIHTSVVDIGYDQDVLVGTALVNMYGKCRSLHDARGVFNGLSDRDVVSWNAMVSIFSQTGNVKEALHYFYQMLIDGFKPNNVSFISVLEACALEEGQAIHAAIVDSSYEGDVEVSTALFTMYGKYGKLHNAMHVFERMPCRSIVSWNAMIAVFAQNTHGKDALKLYKRMHLEGFEPDKSTFTSVLDACASLAALEEGQDVHAAIICYQHEHDTLLCNALISLYGECGSMYEARRVFDRMHCRDVVSWTAVITGSVQNGQNKEALCLFHRMHLEGFKPDNITFVSVLTACGRSGWLDEGSHFFISMKRDHGITPSGEHYLCMIYLLGRAGHLDDAEELIENMSSEKVGMAWLSLLGTCKIHGDIERGLKAAQNCVKFTPAKVSPYVLLSNMYAADVDQV